MPNNSTDIQQWNQYSTLYHQGKGTDGDDLHKTLIAPTLHKFMVKGQYQHILDAGCGNDFLTKQLAETAKEAVGIDSSVELLQFARDNFQQQNIKFELANLSEKLNFADTSFDLVVANMVLQYLPSLENFASETKRLLKNGGAFFMFIDHPAHALFLRAQELVGHKNTKFLDSDSYFQQGLRKKNSLWDKAILQYYHRTIADYFNIFAKDFRLIEMQEISNDGETPRILAVEWRKIKNLDLH